MGSPLSGNAKLWTTQNLRGLQFDRTVHAVDFTNAVNEYIILYGHVLWRERNTHSMQSQHFMYVLAACIVEHILSGRFNKLISNPIKCPLSDSSCPVFELS